MDGAIPKTDWPVVGDFKPVSRRPKAEKSPAPDLRVSIDAKGKVFVSLAALLVDEGLCWSSNQALSLTVCDRAGVVFLRLSPDGAGAYKLRPPVKPRKDGAPGRSTVSLGLCGAGEKLATRKPCAVEFTFRPLNVDPPCVLMLAVPRVVDAPAAEGEDEDDDESSTEVRHEEVTSSAPARKSKSLSARAGAREFKGLDLASLCELAVDHVMKAWPKRIERDANPIRIAAAVALIELGADRRHVMEQLDVEGFILPAREDMRPPGITAATKALEALKEATA